MRETGGRCTKGGDDQCLEQTDFKQKRRKLLFFRLPGLVYFIYADQDSRIITPALESPEVNALIFDIKRNRIIVKLKFTRQYEMILMDNGAIFPCGKLVEADERRRNLAW